MGHANRTEERVSMSVPVRLRGGGSGTTRDISASGIYFETDSAPALELPLDLTVEFSGGSGGMALCCKAEVLRFERLGSRVGVAVRLLESKLEPRRATPEYARLDISDGFADSF